MLKDVVDFIMSETSLPRIDALRKINLAWRECWNSDDMPNSVFEIDVAPIDNNARISLPWYVDEIRGVKQSTFGRERVHLNTPRPWYQDQTYYQSMFTWRLLGTSPLIKSITNATTLDLKFNEFPTETTMVTLIGQNDNGNEVREQVVFKTTEKAKTTVNRFSDLVTCTKDVLTPADLRIVDGNGVDIGYVPNSAFEARNQVVQVSDKYARLCNFCRCFSVLFKKPAPYLYYDETPVPFPEVLMAKTMEWITMPKEGQEQKTVMYGEKARNLLVQFNNNEQSVEHKMDIGTSLFEKQYYGKL